MPAPDRALNPGPFELTPHHSWNDRRAKRRIAAEQLSNFTALDAKTKHEFMMTHKLPTLRNVYKDRNPLDMTEEQFADLVREDRRRPMAKIWSLQ